MFFAEINEQVASWGYLVHIFSDTAYIAGAFTLPDFRRQGVASAMLNEMHRYALSLGIRRILLVPSFIAWNFYSKRGYNTIAYYSNFLPSEKLIDDRS